MQHDLKCFEAQVHDLTTLRKKISWKFWLLFGKMKIRSDYWLTTFKRNMQIRHCLTEINMISWKLWYQILIFDLKRWSLIFLTYTSLGLLNATTAYVLLLFYHCQHMSIDQHKPIIKKGTCTCLLDHHYENLSLKMTLKNHSYSEIQYYKRKCCTEKFSVLFKCNFQRSFSLT